jgi:hypothetical protein
LSQITLPLGMLVPSMHFNFNLHLPAPAHLLTRGLSALAARVSDEVSGWLTGVATVPAFNFVAARMGGVDASLQATFPPPPTPPFGRSEVNLGRAERSRRTRARKPLWL